jgi:hypothetical protein
MRTKRWRRRRRRGRSINTRLRGKKEDGGKKEKNNYLRAQL